MTNNGLNILTISTKRSDFQTDRVLILEQVTEKNEKTHPTHFLMFSLASRTNGKFGSACRTSRNFVEPKECIFSTDLHLQFYSMATLSIPPKMVSDNGLNETDVIKVLAEPIADGSKTFEAIRREE